MGRVQGQAALMQVLLYFLSSMLCRRHGKGSSATLQPSVWPRPRRHH